MEGVRITIVSIIYKSPQLIIILNDNSSLVFRVVVILIMEVAQWYQTVVKVKARGSINSKMIIKCNKVVIN